MVMSLLALLACATFCVGSARDRRFLPKAGILHNAPEGGAKRIKITLHQANLSTRRVHRRYAGEIGPGLGECGVRISHPPSAASMDCPMECPFVRPDTANFCSFSCVAKEDCSKRNPLTSFADPLTRVCSPCAVPGCMECGYSRNICVLCNERMYLKDGQCVSLYAGRWQTAYLVCAIVAAIIILYLICLACRPEVNEEALKRAEDYRNAVKLFITNRSQKKMRPYPLNTNLTLQEVAGTGTLLHFSWMRYVIIWALVVMVSMLILSKIPVYSIYPAVGDDAHPNDRDVFKTCASAGTTKIKKQVDRADVFYLYFTFGIYIFSTLGTFFLMMQHLSWVPDPASVDEATRQRSWVPDPASVDEATRQRRDLRPQDEASADQLHRLYHYVVRVKGLPIRSGEGKLEEEYAKFFEEAIPDAKVIGVSVVWNSFDSDVKMQRQVDAELDLLDRELDEHMGLSTEMAWTASQKKLEEQIESEGCCQTKRCCSWIDDVLLGRLGSTGEEEKALGEDELSDALKDMRSTGSCFVVFQKVVHRNQALRMGSLEYKDPRTGATSRLETEAVRFDPEQINWEHIGQEGGGRVTRFIGSCCCLTIGILLWTICLYHPYASYVLSWTNAPGVGEKRYYEEFAQTTLLTLPIIVGNQVMYQVCAYLADTIRCSVQGHRDLAYVSMYTIFITFQTVLDVGIVLHQAYGHHNEDSWQLARASGVLGPKAIAQNPSIRETLFTEMVGYLYPVTLLFCYLMEPIGIWALPYHLFKWLIRSRADIGIHEAENVLAPPPFDLSRYGDILISIICCVLVCFIASPDVYVVFIYLVMMLVFCYVWDQFRLLRVCQRSRNDSVTLDIAATMALAVPCALLAAAVVFRNYGAHNSDFTRKSVPIWCVFYFFLHLVVHVPALYFLVHYKTRRMEEVLTTREGEMPPYEDVARDCPHNHFSTNWVHCLRSKHIYRHDQDPKIAAWCVPASLGRQKLIKRAPGLGLYYEAQESADACDFRDDGRQLLADARGKAQEVTSYAQRNVQDIAEGVKKLATRSGTRRAGSETDTDSPLKPIPEHAD